MSSSPPCPRAHRDKLLRAHARDFARVSSTASSNSESLKSKKIKVKRERKRSHKDKDDRKDLPEAPEVEGKSRVRECRAIYSSITQPLRKLKFLAVVRYRGSIGDANTFQRTQRKEWARQDVTEPECPKTCF